MKKITATMFIVLICIIMQGCSVQRSEPPPYQSKMVYDKGGSTLYTIEASSLTQEFVRSNSNIVAVKQKYMGKRVAVDGVTTSIYSSSEGFPGLILRSLVYLPWSVDCIFPKVFIDDIAKMSEGQNVIVIGTVYDLSSSYIRRTSSNTWTVHLKDCILAQPAPQPAQPAKSR